MSITTQLRDWYWEHGAKRTDSVHTITQDKLLRVLKKAGDYDILKKRLDDGARPGLALWGLSQGGKSTLLQSGLDFPKTGEGEFISAFQWELDEPFVFGGKTEGNVPRLNPYEHEIDATACITRFKLAEAGDVPDTRHPVEITLLDELSVLKMLAIGYASNPSDGAERDEDDEAEQLVTKAKIEAILTTEPLCEVSDEASFRPLGRLISALQSVLRATEGQASRRFSDDVRNLGLATLKKIPTDMETVCAKIFWDKDGGVTELYKKALACIGDWKGKKIYCSLEAASVLINMQTYAKARGSAGGEIKENVLRQIERISAKAGPAGTCKIELNTRPSGFLHTPESMVVFQSLIKEMIIPVNKATLERHRDNDVSAALLELLQKGDLLDFPGITFEKPKDTSGKKNREAERAKREAAVYVDIVKFGKTLSAVGISALESVDDFCVIIRLNKHTGAGEKIKTLRRGIEKWKKERNRVRVTSAVTFLMNENFRRGLEVDRERKTPPEAAIQALTKIGSFEELARHTENDLRFVHYVFPSGPESTNTQLTAYQGFLETAKDKIREQFGEDSWLEKIVGKSANGALEEVDGRASFLRFLAGKMDAKRNREEISARVAELGKEIVNSIRYLIPTEGEMESEVKFRQENEELVKKVIDAIEGKIGSAGGNALAVMEKMGSNIIRLTSIDRSNTDSPFPLLPEDVLDDDSKLIAYVNGLPSEVESEMRFEYPPQGFGEALGINPISEEDANQFIKRFVDVLRTGQTAFKYEGEERSGTFLEGILVAAADRLTCLKDLASQTKRDKGSLCSQLRKYIFIKMEDNLSGRETRRSEGGAPGGKRGILDRPSPKDSPYHKVIEEFKGRVKKIAELKQSPREPQAGDAELTAIIKTI
jgi:hypothetical protein